MILFLTLFLWPVWLEAAWMTRPTTETLEAKIGQQQKTPREK